MNAFSLHCKIPLYEEEKVLYNKNTQKKGGNAVNCMKCGREIGEDQVFCDLCLTDMEKYPVKPGIAIQLPNRKGSPALKKPVSRFRQMPTPEEKILKLKKRIKRLIVLWLITLILLAAAMYPAALFIQDQFTLRPGQNYNTITDSSAAQP